MKTHRFAHFVCVLHIWLLKQTNAFQNALPFCLASVHLCTPPDPHVGRSILWQTYKSDGILNRVPIPSANAGPLPQLPGAARPLPACAATTAASPQPQRYELEGPWPRGRDLSYEVGGTKGALGPVGCARHSQLRRLERGQDPCMKQKKNRIKIILDKNPEGFWPPIFKHLNKFKVLLKILREINVISNPQKNKIL